MKNVFKKNAFSIFEVFFEEQVVFFDRVIESRCHDWFHDLAHDVQQSYQSVCFENDVIWSIVFSKRNDDEIFELSWTVI